MSQHAFEAVLKSVADWEVFETMAERLAARLPAIIAERLDSLDERYWMIQCGEHTLTLHLQHYLGISLYTVDRTAEAVFRRAVEICTVD